MSNCSGHIKKYGGEYLKVFILKKIVFNILPRVF